MDQDRERFVSAVQVLERPSAWALKRFMRAPLIF
jgi:hypothetical protein